MKSTVKQRKCCELFWKRVTSKITYFWSRKSWEIVSGEKTDRSNDGRNADYPSKEQLDPSFGQIGVLGAWSLQLTNP